MATTTQASTPPAPTTPAAESGSRGFIARVGLGRRFEPVPREFLLIASTALILTGLGLVMVLSATMATSISNGDSAFEVVMRQALFALLGIPMMLIASRMPLRFWHRIAWIALGVSLALQALVFTPLGVNDAGNRNWIMIGGVQAQPSEFLKLTFAIWLGAVLYRKRGLLGDWRHLLIPIFPVSAIVIGSVLAGNDMGTAIILAFILLGALFFAGVRMLVLMIPVVLGVAGFAVLALTSSNRMRRLTSFLDQSCLADYQGTCYQPLHGMWGLANGQIFGLGLGNSREKYNWLPAAAHDYIFAIVGEELGLIGAVAVLALFAVFALGALRLIRKTSDPFVRIVAGALTVWIVGQALVNIGVVLRVLPPLGLPLPFMSQGGTALIAVLAATGVLLSLARTLPADGSAEPDPIQPVRRKTPLPPARAPRVPTSGRA